MYSSTLRSDRNLNLSWCHSSSLIFITLFYGLRFVACRIGKTSWGLDG
jgi:hypothetical protein